MTIQLLPSEVVDQIAAGEVVERPAHLVKELVENAIDAGATAIEIEFDQGGRRVRVTDDGAGIANEELRLALARHATSKISSADDLWNLGSFGFRGEALSSIAAVSRLAIVSRTRNSSTAYKVSSEFGTISKTETVSGNSGTTVTIEELFANVPARLKFMKTEAGEAGQIKATLRALALANENIEFRIRTKGKLDAVWPRTSFMDRAKQILGVEQLFETQMTYAGFTAQVAFASPHDIAGNARSISIFVQKRWVQDRGLQAAVIDAYRGLLMHGEYPIAVVRILAPCDEVDVNIHPTKSQVKFRDAGSPFRAVNRALREGLEKAPWLTRGAGAQDRVQNEPVSERPKLSVQELTRPYFADSQTSPVEFQPESLASAPVNSLGRFDAPEFNSVVFRQKEDVSFAESNVPNAAPGAWSRLQVIGQANLTYIVTQDENGLIFIDQHAAHERVAYERLMRAWKSGESQVQAMLMPITIELEPDGPESLQSIADELENLGVMFDQIGPQSIAVRAKPALISDKALTKTLRELAHEITERGGSFVLEKKIGDICATLACHSVVRAGQALSIEQMRSLLVQMDEFSLSSFCPHGRPVSVEYPFSKLERDFGRIV